MLHGQALPGGEADADQAAAHPPRAGVDLAPDGLRQVPGVSEGGIGERHAGGRREPAPPITDRPPSAGEEDAASRNTPDRRPWAVP
jgi:hypothetical protein